MRQIDFRKRERMTRAEFAARIGVSQPCVWRYEVVGRVPSSDVMKRIMAEFPEIDIRTYHEGAPNPDRQVRRRRKRQTETLSVAAAE